jgi:hypothetical protein
MRIDPTLFGINPAPGYPFRAGDQRPMTVVVLPDLRAYRAFCVEQDASRLSGPSPDTRRN